MWQLAICLSTTFLSFSLSAHVLHTYVVQRLRGGKKKKKETQVCKLFVEKKRKKKEERKAGRPAGRRFSIRRNRQLVSFETESFRLSVAKSIRHSQRCN